MTLSRRHFMLRGAAFSLGFAGLQSAMVHAGAFHRIRGTGYGPLITDPTGLLDLPEGFRYSIIARVGDRMSDGLLTPGQPDGMASFPGEDGRTILVCNHEIAPGSRDIGAFGPKNELLSKVKPELLYDFGKGRMPGLGGTSTIVFDTKTQKVERHFLSLAGTYRNCAGGPTPWNSWLTCEEDDTNPMDDIEKVHGYVFEVPATSTPSLAAPIPIRGMGRFKHEAVAIDPRTGIVYLTEDREDGLIYRFIPNDRRYLHRGGKLQALAIQGRDSCNTDNHEATGAIAVGEKFRTRWLDLTDTEPLKDDLRHRGFAAGAAKFARGEGMWYGHNAIYFAATTGGRAGCGQIWRYTPASSEGAKDEGTSPGTLELFVEPNDAAVVKNADNLTVSPWGDLMVCEDGATETRRLNHLLGITPSGEVYKFAAHGQEGSELAGVNFSPDGTTMFVNLQSIGLTLAVTGPWKR
jgi:secreted PhoX family phosphatase